MTDVMDIMDIFSVASLYLKDSQQTWFQKDFTMQLNIDRGG